MKTLAYNYYNTTTLENLLNQNSSLRLPTTINNPPSPQHSGMVVIIDSHLEDYQTLVEGVYPGAQVLLLSSHQEVITQISDYLCQCSKITSIHIVSHGESGCLYLGNSQLNLGNLEQYAPLLKTGLPSSQIPILLYGCQVAAGKQGKAFVEKLSQITGNPVAASAQLTGNSALGGNWQLEFQTGKITSPLAFQPWVLAEYQGIFATFTVADADTVGLIAAIQAANDEDTNPGVDTIVLATNSTYTLTESDSSNDAIDGDQPEESFDYGATGLPFITSEIVIEGNGSTIAGQNDGSNPFRLFTIIGENAPLYFPPFNIYPTADGNLTLDNLVLTGGYTEQDPNDSIGGVLDDGGAILNVNGVLTVNNSVIESNTAGDDGGAIANLFGGEVSVNSTILRNNQTGLNPDGDGAGGGAIANLGGVGISTVTVSNSEISSNSVLATEGQGGGIANEDNGVVNVVSNSTISSNTVDGSEEDIFNQGDNNINAVTIDDGSSVEVLNDENNVETTVSFANASVSVGEDTVSTEIILNRSDDLTQEAVVTVSVSGGSATAGADYGDDFPVAVTFAPNQISQTVNLTVIDDEEIEVAEDITLELGGDGDVLIGNQSTTTVVINDNDEDNDAEAIIAFANSDLSVLEDVGSAEIILDRTNDLTQEAVVTVSVSGGSAVAGADYGDDFPVAVTFAPNQTSQTVNLTVIDDEEIEVAEDITLELGGDGDVLIGNQSTTTVVINDNDEDNDGSLPEALELSNNNTLLISGDSEDVNLKITLQGVETEQINQLLVYRVQDVQTDIDILAQGQVIFSNLSADSNQFLSSRGLDNLETILSDFASGDEIGFALIPNGTQETASPQDLIIGSVDGDNNLQISFSGDGFVVQFEDGDDGDFEDLEILVEITEDEPPLGANLQGVVELIDLRDLEGQQVSPQITFSSQASFGNQGGLYIVEDEAGTVVDSNNQTISPGETGYAQAALGRSVVNFGSLGGNISLLDGGFLYAPYIIADGDTQQFYSPFSAANSDGLDHVLMLGSNIFGFEDTVNLGDGDYNDFTIEVDLTVQ